MQARLTRRILSWLATRLAVLPWSKVTDPRVSSNTYWQLTTVLQAVVMGLVAGARSLAELEALTDSMSVAARRWFKLARRLPDTTMRELLVRLIPDELRALLHAQIRSFYRQKALVPDPGFRWGVASMDGKVTAIRAWDGRYVQRQGDKGMVRTITATLVSTAGRPCLDAYPIPASTNEMGAYLAALTALVAAYKGIDLFRVVMYDAGACSEANAAGTRKLGLHYVMQLNESQPTLYAEAKRVLAKAPQTLVEFDDQQGRVRYHIKKTAELAGFLDWKHLRTVVHIHREVLGRDGAVQQRGDRHFVSSLAPDSLDAEGWAQLLRARWGVENNTHHTFDAVLGEDERPWFQEHPVGALNIIILRRLAYNAMSLYRARTLRAEANRLIPWRTLIRWVVVALITATEDAVKDLRARAPP